MIYEKMMIMQEIVLLLVLALVFHTTGYPFHYHPSRLSRTEFLPSQTAEMRSSLLLLPLKREAVEEEGRRTRRFSSSSIPTGSRPVGESLQDIEEVEEEEEAEKKNAYKVVLPALALAALGGIFAFTHHLDLSGLLDQVVDTIADLGPYGYLLFAVVYIMAEILAVPAIPLTASSGYLFGLIPGTAIVLVSATIAAAISFLIGRTYLRTWAQGFISGATLLFLLRRH